MGKTTVGPEGVTALRVAPRPGPGGVSGAARVCLQGWGGGGAGGRLGTHCWSLALGGGGTPEHTLLSWGIGEDDVQACTGPVLWPGMGPLTARP